MHTSSNENITHSYSFKITSTTHASTTPTTSTTHALQEPILSHVAHSCSPPSPSAMFYQVLCMPCSYVFCFTFQSADFHHCCQCKIWARSFFNFSIFVPFYTSLTGRPPHLYHPSTTYYSDLRFFTNLQCWRRFARTLRFSPCFASMPPCGPRLTSLLCHLAVLASFRLCAG